MTVDYTKNIFQTEQRQNYDQGLRDYMLKIYNLMAGGLAITGIFAFLSLNFMPLTQMLYNTTPSGAIMGMSTFGYVVSFAPLGIAVYFFWFNNNISLETSKILFWVYATLIGMSLSSIMLVYTAQSVARTFFICSTVFAGTSLYGYTTNRDLTSIGSFLVMGVIGLIATSLVNLYLQSPAIYYATSFVGVFIFIGLTAWDTQKLKTLYFQSGGGEAAQRFAVMGAFMLYLDFINLFLYLLRFFGDRKN